MNCYSDNLGDALMELREKINSLAVNQLKLSLDASLSTQKVLKERLACILEQSAVSAVQTNTILSELCLDVQSSLTAMATEWSKIDLSNFVLVDQGLANNISSAITATQPYMTEKLWEECEETVLLPLHEPIEKRRLSFADIATLICTLFAVLSFIVAIMPDPQLDEIIDQNKQLIALEQERLDLDRQRTEKLKDIACSLTDAISSLNELVDSQAKQSDILSDKSDSPDDFELTQQQNDDCYPLD